MLTLFILLMYFILALMIIVLAGVVYVVLDSDGCLCYRSLSGSCPKHKESKNG